MTEAAALTRSLRRSVVHKGADGNDWILVSELDPSTVLYRRITADEYREVDNALSGVNVIAVVDVKGGVRKTTAAVHIAHGLQRYTGERVAIGDCDQYHSVADWHQMAHMPDLQSGEPRYPWSDDITVLSADGDNFHWELVEGVTECGARWLVIDTPPNDTAAARRALLGADMMLMPTGPWAMDIRRLQHGMEVAADVVNKRGGRGVLPRALITGAKLGTNVYKAARLYLQQEKIPAFSMPIRDIVAHASAFGTNLRSLEDYDFLPEDIVRAFRGEETMIDG